MKKLCLLLGLLALGTAAFAAPLGSAFTFQGSLHESGQPANGTYEFEFVLFDAATGGSGLGPVNTREEIAVTNGLFTVQLDFGPAAFDGNARWLEISVKNDLTGAAGILSPRTPISPTPYALMAADVKDGAISGAKLADGAVSGSKVAQGSIGSGQIANGAVQAQHLAAGAVGSQHIVAGAIGSAQLANGAVGSQQLALGAVTAQSVASGAIGADKLTSGAALNNLLAGGQSPVAGGGVILSESPTSGHLLSAGYVRLGEQALELSAERWTNLGDAPNLPGGETSGRRRDHTTVWTGSEAIIWGGYSYDSGTVVNTGLRYKPANNSWTAMNTNGAPSPRSNATAVWTGTEMIVWGGNHNTGARYNPTTDAWTPMSTVNAPAARSFHKAIWTGTEMIVWGGQESFDGLLNTGGRYNPSTDTWTAMPTTGAPFPRNEFSAVWTGTQMIIWGGVTNGSFSYVHTSADGARYNPANNTWSPMTLNNAPVSRYGHSTVWTGTEMIILGGIHSTFVSSGCVPIPNPPFMSCDGEWIAEDLQDGARYNPANNSWTALTAAPTNAPGFSGHAAVWTGTEMVVWGGTATVYVPPPPGCWLIPIFLPCSGTYEEHVTNVGLRFRPSDNSWQFISSNNVPAPREHFTANWIGTELFIWGDDFNVGGRYSPANNSWTTTAPAPSPDSTERTDFASVWTGTEWIIWGGQNHDGALLRSGLKFNPSANTWTVMNLSGAPTARKWASATWTGSEVIIWGGQPNVTSTNTASVGARYNPLTDTWRAMSTTNAPAGRRHHTAVWTGTELVIWGGSIGIGATATGARYNPSTDTWTPTSMNNVPSPRPAHTAVWTGSEMVIWGGGPLAPYEATGGRYNPATDSWTATALTGVPAGRAGHSAVWTGTEMIVWGGIGFGGTKFNDGARYNPVSNGWTPMKASGLEARSAFTGVWAHSKFIVWGGSGTSGTQLQTGGVYDLATDSWTSTLTDPTTPGEREGHAAVWTGTQMLLWGGRSGSNIFIDMFSYSPARKFYLYLKP
jgi:N-acetylneuraminic acid mutarotase